MVDGPTLLFFFVSNSSRHITRAMKLTVSQAEAVLSLSEGYNEDSLRVAYKKAALKWHPVRRAVLMSCVFSIGFLLLMCGGHRL